jgi:hypothetical protein
VEGNKYRLDGEACKVCRMRRKGVWGVWGG